MSERTGWTTRDLSGRLNTATLIDQNATDWVEAPELGRRAMSFDGSLGHLALPAVGSLDGATSFTIAVWLKKLDAGAFDIHRGVFAQGSGIQRTPWFWGLFESENYCLQFETTVGGPADCNLTFGPATDGDWQHVAVTWDGTTVRAYLDGTLHGTTDTTTGHQMVDSDGDNVVGLLTGYGCWLGELTDLLVFRNMVLPQGAITHLANPQNVMLDGLLTPRRRIFAATTAGPFPHHIRRAMQGGMIGQGL